MDIKISLSGESVNQYLVDKFSAVGMIRGEYLLRFNDEHITMKSCQDKLQEYVSSIAKAFYPKPVWYRCIELWSDEANTLQGNDLVLHETNPIVGLRGLRRAFQTKDTFETEINLIKEVAEEYDNLNIIFPFVGDADEFARGVNLLDRVKWPNRIGTMLEIPSAILDTPKFVKEGASNLMIGMNDLSCLMLGAARISGYDNKRHRAMWQAVDYVKQNAKGVEWGIAGNLNKEFIEEAKKKDVPYLSLHYFDLENTMGILPDLLPDKNFVRKTKDKTRARIRSYNNQRVLNDLEESN